MNITKDIIGDLLPLYVANECSADTRAVVNEYLRQHPQEAAELRHVMSTPMPGTAPKAPRLDEMESLLKARRIIRLRSWLMAFAIFFSLAPFSFLHTAGRTYWFLLESPVAALIYGAAAVALWIAYAVARNRSKGL